MDTGQYPWPLCLVQQTAERPSMLLILAANVGIPNVRQDRTPMFRRCDPCGRPVRGDHKGRAYGTYSILVSDAWKDALLVADQHGAPLCAVRLPDDPVVFHLFDQARRPVIADP